MPLPRAQFVRYDIDLSAKGLDSHYAFLERRIAEARARFPNGDEDAYLVSLEIEPSKRAGATISYGTGTGGSGADAYGSRGGGTGDA